MRIHGDLGLPLDVWYRLAKNDTWKNLPRSRPLDLLRFLMGQHRLLQKDLTDIFGTPSIVSEVLSGKRELNKDHILRLAGR
jgi:antitoxin component HigA of HigAB toxin-antitoxin module